MARNKINNKISIKYKKPSPTTTTTTLKITTPYANAFID